MQAFTVKVLLIIRYGWCIGENVSGLLMISHRTFVHVLLSILLVVQQEKVKDTQNYSRLSE